LAVSDAPGLFELESDYRDIVFQFKLY